MKHIRIRMTNVSTKITIVVSLIDNITVKLITFAYFHHVKNNINNNQEEGSCCIYENLIAIAEIAAVLVGCIIKTFVDANHTTVSACFGIGSRH
jgi:exoribonuclease II